MFVKTLIDESGEQVSYEIVGSFLSTAMSFIGLNYKITIKEIAEQSFTWPNRVKLYRFKHDPAQLDKFCLCLGAICDITSQEEELNEAKFPVSYLMDLVSLWLKLSTDREKLGDAEKYFKEPFAQISNYLQ